MAVNLYTFMENALTITGEKEDLLSLAQAIRESSQNEGTLSDLAFQIEYEFDVDGIRSEDTDWED